MRGNRLLRCGVIVVSCVAVGQLPSAQSLGPGHDGAARLFGLDQVTVVYPAGSTSDRETHRRSALRRADFLRATHDVRAMIAADDSVSPEQLRGNLLLLGWGNRLLLADEAKGPIVETDDGRRFVGGLRIDAGDDLLFAWTSPYNRQKLLIFWSRIDDELDRFMSLPFVTSDWALYRDFLILGQGMFAEADGWPPQRNLYGERPPAEPRPQRPPASHGSSHYRLHASPRLPDTQAERILAAREAAWDKATTRLGGAPEDLIIDLYVYRDRAQMAEQAGVRDAPGFSIPARGEMHLTQELALLETPHEEIHVLAGALLGPAPLSAMFEGLAAALEHDEPATELAMYAAGLVEQRRAPSIGELLDEEQQRAWVRSGMGLGAAGLLVHWLRSRADEATFRSLYTLPTGSADEAAALLGLETAAMEQAFAEWLAAQAASARDDYTHSKILAEARRLGAAGDRRGELAELRKALAVRPDDPDTLYLTGLAHLRGGDPGAAEETLSKLLEATEEGRESATHVLGVYRLGQALDQLGRSEEALARFESLLGLPDLHESHRRARQAIERVKRRQRGD